MKVRFTERQTLVETAPHFPAASDRPTVAHIDLGALERNYRLAERQCGGRSIIAVVKAQAYGHGAIPVSQRLQELGAAMLGVGLVEEGRELREAGITAPLLLMDPLFPEQVDAVVENKLTPVVFSESLVHGLSAAARKRNAILDVHVKIDTGMGRIGVSPEEAAGLIERISAAGNLRIQGLMTHFADADLRDKSFAGLQTDRFEQLLRSLADRGVTVPMRHAANSAAVLDFHRALFTAVRPGLMLYGYDPVENGGHASALEPVLSLLTRIAVLRRFEPGTPVSYGRTFVTKRSSLIAVLPVGYADGFSRGLSNRGHALVRGRRAPVVGRVCMDMCMIDVTDIPDVCEGDAVALIGKQGNEAITAEDIAGLTGTIAYEVLCGVSSRVPRIYH
jgi:alanine racemase